MRPVRLHEIREAARTADARDGRDLLVPELALLDELEVKREHGEVAATRTPRRMVGDDFFSGQSLALGVGDRGHHGDTAAASRDFCNGFVHGIISSWESLRATRTPSADSRLQSALRRREVI